ncbi:ORF6N domain-containing protein [bacterium]|jgi:ORF6N domain|nr:ORF6N domain-containing protein [bacterium]NDA10494.1 ORF6N domain-containing protein [Verrucomicrobiota bacterium]NDA27041.1 ORF6N domain-containing protein [Verrucomicrobiota bacterium]
MHRHLETLILTLRNQKVLLDADLAAIYGVPTRALNQAVKRNAARFPKDFLFQLTHQEKKEVVTNCDHLARLKFSPVRPYAFTEHGALMVANVLNSARAVKMSVYVVRAFIKQREMLMAQADILKRLAQMDKKLLQHDEVLKVIWTELQPLLQPPPAPPKPRIGF